MVPRDVAHVLLRICEEANTPRSLAVAILLEAGELDQLLELRVDPSRYKASNAFFKDVLVTDLLRKCQGLLSSESLDKKAVETFFESEHSCYRANERLTPFLYGACPPGMERAEEVFSLARKYISHILGACPIPHNGKFGPGATFADRGKRVTVPDKISSVPTLTADALGLLPLWGRTLWGRAISRRNGRVDVVRGNRFTTVPKDSTKNRGIAVEPSLNIFYQLSYGSLIRERLRRVDVHLDKLQDHHRDLAQKASIDGSLATIDLSNASDTLCVALVELLLPPTWSASLKSLRSPFTFVNGSWTKLEKFSSMGNGFTFELETLVFQALVFSVLTLRGFIPREGVNMSVFGDDIIIPSEAYEDVTAVLKFCGFTLNAKKSFAHGSFRESCGGDFFDGRPSRGFYLKELPSEPHHWIAFLNGLRRVILAHHLNEGDVLDSHAWHIIAGMLPVHIRSLAGPPGLGDIVVHTEESRWQPCSREYRNGRLRPLGPYDPRVGDGIRYFRSWQPVQIRHVGWNHFQPDVVLATALYGVGNGRLGVTPRDSVVGYDERWVPFS
jgi:hypothetical protein